MHRALQDLCLELDLVGLQVEISTLKCPVSFPSGLEMVRPNRRSESPLASNKAVAPAGKAFNRALVPDAASVDFLVNG